MANVASGKMLKEHNLRHTACREEVLAFFLERETALSHADLETHLTPAYDRVTLYRTLKTFLDAGLVHKVLDDEGGAKYALCRSHHNDHQHADNHVHFKCLRCGATSCLDYVSIPAVSLPEGYEGVDMHLLVQGICRACTSPN